MSKISLEQANEIRCLLSKYEYIITDSYKSFVVYSKKEQYIIKFNDKVIDSIYIEILGNQRLNVHYLSRQSGFLTAQNSNIESLLNVLQGEIKKLILYNLDLFMEKI